MFAGAGEVQSDSLVLGWGTRIQEGIRQKGRSSRRITGDKDIAHRFHYLGMTLSYWFQSSKRPPFLWSVSRPSNERKGSRGQES